MKQCNTCNISKSESEFAIKRTRADGTKQRNSICKNCHNSKAKDKYILADKTTIYKNIKKNRNKYRQQMYDFLSTKKCTDCQTSDIRVLEFDHMTDKKFNI